MWRLQVQGDGGAGDERGTHVLSPPTLLQTHIGWKKGRKEGVEAPLDKYLLWVEEAGSVSHLVKVELMKGCGRN